MYLSQPYRIDGTGRTTMTDDVRAYARALIEAVLFTAPGERVNRPGFGSGVREMLFDANNQALETAADFLIQSAIQQHLSEVVTVQSLEVRRDGGVLEITLTYGVRGSDAPVTERFRREV
jgi:phage baseplate assembly protein W